MPSLLTCLVGKRLGGGYASGGAGGSSGGGAGEDAVDGGSQAGAAAPQTIAAAAAAAAAAACLEDHWAVRDGAALLIAHLCATYVGCSAPCLRSAGATLVPHLACVISVQMVLCLCPPAYAPWF